jgi:energy-coupling factor transport system ATP-binding protein
MLDPQGRAEVMEIIDRLHRDGITIVLITHFMEETVKADRILIMDGGKVVMDGAPTEIFRRAAEIRALDLDVPLAVDLRERLRKRGHPIPADLIETEEMVAYLCRSASEN